MLYEGWEMRGTQRRHLPHHFRGVFHFLFPALMSGLLWVVAMMMMMGIVCAPNLDVFGAAARGDVATVEAALSAGVPADVESNGETALMVASLHGRPEVVRLLLRFGARNVSGRNSHGEAAIHLACRGTEPGHAEAVRVLLEAGVPINAQTSKGETPRSIATPLVLAALDEFDRRKRPAEL